LPSLAVAGPGFVTTTRAATGAAAAVVGAAAGVAGTSGTAAAGALAAGAACAGTLTIGTGAGVTGTAGTNGAAAGALGRPVTFTGSMAWACPQPARTPASTPSASTAALYAAGVGNRPKWGGNLGSNIGRPSFQCAKPMTYFFVFRRKKLFAESILGQEPTIFPRICLWNVLPEPPHLVNSQISGKM
jgi:hypothetical protein